MRSRARKLGTRGGRKRGGEEVKRRARNYFGPLPTSRSTSPTRYSEPVTSTCSRTCGCARAMLCSHSSVAPSEGATAPPKEFCAGKPEGVGAEGAMG